MQRSRTLFASGYYPERRPTIEQELAPPAMYTRAEIEKMRLQEYALSEALDLAKATLARCGNRLDALAWVAFAWADATLDAPVDGMVRETAIELLLDDTNPTERDIWETVLAVGVETFPAAHHAITALLTADVPVRQAVAA